MAEIINNIDSKLINIIQSDFPINNRPYKVISDKLGITEEEVILRIKKLKANRIIRKIGCVFDPRKLGYKSILCAVKVDNKRINEVSKIINSYDGITHNYLRKHSLNMWFTLIAPSENDISNILFEIESKINSGKILRLRAKKVFKIKVKFNIKN